MLSEETYRMSLTLSRDARIIIGMNTYTVTVGRNIGDVPMPRRTWNYLIRSIVKELTPTSGDAWVEVHVGTGQYDSTTEESAMITLLSEDSLSEPAIDYLKRFLKELAGLYGQECIALTRGTSELIFA